MPRYLPALLFLALAAENYSEGTFDGRWRTPMRDIGDLLYTATPIKAPGLAVFIVGLWLLRRNTLAARTNRIHELDRFIALNFFVTVGWLGWGLLRGGALSPGLMQILQILFLPLSALMFLAVVHSERDFRALGKAIVLAALYRATMAAVFRYLIVPGLGIEMPLVMTTHADSVLFATGIIIVTAWASESKERQAIRRALWIDAVLLFAIQINNRRLAYVALGGSVVVLYLMVDNPALKRRLNRRMLIASPLLAAYLLVGANSQHPFFKPAQSLASMVGSKQDSSSQTRDIENYNLTVTLRDHPIAGSGWGHEYNEVSVAYSISEIFPLYRYIPHNSVLGLWAFTGYLGSTGFWSVFVLSAYLAIRGYRLAREPLPRSICAVAVSEVTIYGLQGYGDMGLTCWGPTLLLGLSIAASSRMAAMHASDDELDPSGDAPPYQ